MANVPGTTRQVAIVVFPQVTMLDVIGPYESLWRLPDTTVTLVARDRDPVVTNGGAQLVPGATFAERPHPDVLIVPGGAGTTGAAEDAETVAYLRASTATAEWVATVCTGSVLLAATGAISGRRASTHWRSRERLAQMGVEVTDERVTFDGNLASSAGVSAGIDLGLALAARLTDELTARAIQLGMEYRPEPPFDIGDVGTAPEPELLARADALAKLWFGSAS